MLFIAFSLLDAACNDAREVASPEKQEGQKAEPAPPAAEEKLEYPTFEPFLGPMWDVMFGEPGETLDLKELIADARQQFEIVEEASDAAAELAPPSVEGAPSAMLEPELPTADRAWYCVLPAVLMQARTLWDVKSWTREDVALGQLAADFMHLNGAAPRSKFADGRDDSNRKQLEELVRWYWRTIQRPEVYAAMIFTLDMGPYAGLPFEPSGDAKVILIGSQKLDDESEIQLCLADGLPEPYVVRCVHKGKTEWARLISDSPDRTVRRVELTERAPTRMGRYGWQLHLLANWSGGAESARLYIGPDRRFLFYYLSW